MTRKEMINKLEGNCITISAKTFDSDFEFALDMVRGWACDSCNTCDEEYLSQFKEEGMLQYCFTEYGYSIVGGVHWMDRIINLLEIELKDSKKKYEDFNKNRELGEDWDFLDGYIHGLENSIEIIKGQTN